MFGIRNQGFGLNYNQGFGTGKSFVGGGYDPQAQRQAATGYQQKMAQDQQDQADAARLRDQQNQFALNLGQREKEGQRDADLRQAGYANQLQLGHINADAATAGTRAQTDRFNQVFPYLSNALNGLGSSGDVTGGYRGAGPQGQQPVIDADNVLTDQQIQQQVNSRRATNDQSTAGAQRRVGQQMAARGYGSQSPLAMELGMGLQNQNLAQNTADERDTRYQAAQGNATQRLSAQSAREGQYASRQQEEIERNKVVSGRYNALLGALAGLV